MLLKKIIAASAAFLLAVAPLAGFAGPGTVATGVFPNGAKMFWQCQEDTKGVVRILLVTPDGQKYQADLSCGEDI